MERFAEPNVLLENFRMKRMFVKNALRCVQLIRKVFMVKQNQLTGLRFALGPVIGLAQMDAHNVSRLSRPIAQLRNLD